MVDFLILFAEPLLSDILLIEYYLFVNIVQQRCPLKKLIKNPSLVPYEIYLFQYLLTLGKAGHMAWPSAVR